MDNVLTFRRIVTIVALVGPFALEEKHAQAELVRAPPERPTATVHASTPATANPTVARVVTPARVPRYVAAERVQPFVRQGRPTVRAPAKTSRTIPAVVEPVEMLVARDNPVSKASVWWFVVQVKPTALASAAI